MSNATLKKILPARDLPKEWLEGSDFDLNRAVEVSVEQKSNDEVDEKLTNTIENIRSQARANSLTQEELDEIVEEAIFDKK